MKTDIQIQQDVIAELRWDPKINAAQIGVEVRDGVVTILGHVYSLAEKYHAIKTVKRVSGVKVMSVELDVIILGSHQKNDTEIALSVKNALEYSSYNLSDVIKAKVENGFITLFGNVGWHYEKEAAENTLLFMKGIRGIINQINVKPIISIAAIKSDIEAALDRRIKNAFNNINIKLINDEVVLSGKVHNWADRLLAVNAAWSSPGVKAVVDQMQFE